jgi:hypothetical protein
MKARHGTPEMQRGCAGDDTPQRVAQPVGTPTCGTSKGGLPTGLEDLERGVGRSPAVGSPPPEAFCHRLVMIAVPAEVTSR